MAWVKSESQLKPFINEINQKHLTIKFDKEKQHFIKNQLTTKIMSMKNLYILFR